MTEPTDENLRWMKARLAETLARLAAPAAQQRAYIEQLGSAPCVDELALEFDDMYIVKPLMLSRGALSTAETVPLDAVDALLKAMSGRHQAVLWDLDALDKPEWARVRELARSALSCLEPYEPL